MVGYGRPAASDPALDQAGAGPPGGSTPPTPRPWAWAALLRRVLALDVLACPCCGGRLRVIATVQDPAVVRTILAHLGLSGAADPPGPAPPAPAASA